MQVQKPKSIKLMIYKWLKKPLWLERPTYILCNWKETDDSPNLATNGQEISLYVSKLSSL